MNRLIASLPPKARRLLTLDIRWVESEHPREHGRFVRKGEGASREHEKGERPDERKATVAKGPVKRRHVKLKPQERIKVEHEINTIYHAMFEGKRFCRITTHPDKDSPAYDYFFINHGFDRYEFTVKRRNKK